LAGVGNGSAPGKKPRNERKCKEGQATGTGTTKNTQRSERSRLGKKAPSKKHNQLERGAAKRTSLRTARGKETWTN